MNRVLCNDIAKVAGFRFDIMLAVVVTIIFMAGCAATGPIPSNIPPDKLFSKIKVGMSRQQMVDLIGSWNDSEVKTAGAAISTATNAATSAATSAAVSAVGSALPFGLSSILSSGAQNVTSNITGPFLVAYYKDNGRVYLKDDRITKIEYDPSEDGYK